jgi:hypothetical protein
MRDFKLVEAFHEPSTSSSSAMFLQLSRTRTKDDDEDEDIVFAGIDRHFTAAGL